jgi:lipoprotein-anchoring transpeptidase ErfK/SrfK
VPALPVIVSPSSSWLTNGTVVVTGRVGPTVDGIDVTGAISAEVTLSPASSEGATFTARITLPYGRRVVGFAAREGADWSEHATLTLWNLGDVPKASRFVLVDKSDYMLYVVRSQRVVASYPVAIGTRGTPTPTGTRYLGRPGPSPSGVWGPFRMKLYKQAWVRVAVSVKHVYNHRHHHYHHVTHYHRVLRKVGTSYYIHGTNEPDRIGTMASHGCIRMFNSDLQVFRTLTYKYQLTVIRS